MTAPAEATKPLIAFNEATNTFDWFDGVEKGSAASMAEAKFLSIMRFARKVVQIQCRNSEPADIEDAFQDAMMKIWMILEDETHEHHWTAMIATPAWFGQRAGWLARSYLYTQRRRDKRLLQLAEFDGPATATDLTTALIDQYDVERIMAQIIAELPPHARVLIPVLRMMFIGYSMSQAAQVIGLNKSNVSRQIGRYIKPIVAAMTFDESSNPRPVMFATENHVQGAVIQLSLDLQAAA